MVSARRSRERWLQISLERLSCNMLPIIRVAQFSQALRSANFNTFVPKLVNLTQQYSEVMSLQSNIYY